jgi:hypothetical protein
MVWPASRAYGPHDDSLTKGAACAAVDEGAGICAATFDGAFAISAEANAQAAQWIRMELTSGVSYCPSCRESLSGKSVETSEILGRDHPDNDIENAIKALCISEEP